MIFLKFDIVLNETQQDLHLYTASAFFIYYKQVGYTVTIKRLYFQLHIEVAIFLLSSTSVSGKKVP